MMDEDCTKPDLGKAFTGIIEITILGRKEDEDGNGTPVIKVNTIHMEP
jgi:hypothetical protein